MKLATIRINLTKEGHEVIRENVTPAELALLTAEHHAASGGKPFEIDSKGDFSNDSVKETGDVKERTTGEEKQRLKSRYAANKVEAMFPGASPNMPTDFKSAYKLGLGTILPATKLTEVGR